MIDSNVSDSQPIEQAEAWFARLRGELVTAEDYAEFAAWLDRDPDNKSAFDQVTDLWHLLGGLDALQVSGGERTEPVAAAQTASLEAHRQRKPQPLPGTRLKPLAVAATVLLCAGLAWFAGLDRSVEHVEMVSVVGQQRSSVLTDGSEVTVNTDSALTGELSASKRAFQLNQGEAFFSVAADANRPFSVHADSVTATALGTAFSVQVSQLRGAGNTAERSVSVTVLEGRVEVAAGNERVIVGADQRATFDGNSLSSASVRAADAVGWRDGRLVYVDVTLEELVTDLNRYLPRPMAITDEDLRAERVSAVLNLSDQASMLDALSHVLPMQWRVVSDSLVLITPGAASS